jgi:hypothetical protein
MLETRIIKIIKNSTGHQDDNDREGVQRAIK